MSEQPRDDDQDAEVVPLHPRGDVAVPEPPDAHPAVPADVSYEVELDQEPAAAAVPVDPAPGTVTLLPVVPAHLRTRAGVRAAAARQGRLARHHAAYHGIRAPLYVARALGYAAVGALAVGWHQVAWAFVLEQHALRTDAAADGAVNDYLKLHKAAAEARKVRLWVLLAEVIALAAGVLLLIRVVPWWGDALAAVVVLPLLALAGRPADRRIVSQATVTPRFRKLSADIVLRSYYAAGLGHPDKPDQQVTFGGPMHRDGEGSRVVVDLPYGRTLRNAMNAREEIASGLDVQVSQVFIHRDPTSTRRHVLWVSDRDPLALPAGRTPLLACKATDIWKPAPLGLDERGQLVRVPLMWQSVLVSALPRAGKTFSARLLALYAALDPYVRLSVFDLKGSPDWRSFAKVADAAAFGLTRTRAGDPLEIIGRTLDELRADVADRNHRLSQLPVDVCPQGKLTREIARDPRYRMPVRVVVLEEFQELYDLPGDLSKEVAPALTFLIKVAPSVGVILLGSTQRPSGIGSGQVAQQFTSFRDQFPIRFGLRTSSWQVSELCLGAGAYSEGLDTSTLLPSYRGVGILRGASDVSPTVRCHLADGQDAEKILAAARRLRQQAGTLTGMAAGEEETEEASSIAGDVLAVLGDERGMHWAVIAELLRRKFPERHADCTQESVSRMCDRTGIPSRQVRYLGTNRQGCYRADAEAAARKAREQAQ